MNDSSTAFGSTSTTTGAGGTIGSVAGSGPTVYPATVDAVQQRSPWRLTTIALVLALLIGGLGGGWLALQYLAPAQQAEAPTAPPAASPPGQPVQATQRAAQPVQLVAAPPLTAAESGAIAARLGLLEERLARITLAAESASGNAARAEALLVAFAARRAIERGFPLGSMEAQLRLRFGETQPNAVNSILSASANPVTAEQLAQHLESLRTVLVVDAQAGWMTRLGNSLGSLVVLRPADQPSSRPARRFERAMRAVANGRVDEAIMEVEAMPGHADPLAASWLNEARRYHDARRALDLIETAAILEPGANRDPEGPRP